MNAPRLLVINRGGRPLDLALRDEAIDLMAQHHGMDALRVVDPHRFFQPGAKPRDAAVAFFAPMARTLMSGGALLLTDHWSAPEAALDAARRRLLERTALTLGVAQVGAASGPLPLLSARESLSLPSGPLPGYLGPGAGAFSPNGALLVGDRPNNATHGQLKHRLPFFSLHHGGCSLWLADQLERAGVPERLLYWINAYDAHDEPTPSDFVKELRPNRVIALGKAASGWCAQAGLLCHEVEHPMRHKRFNYGKPYPLIKLLKENAL